MDCFWDHLESFAAIPALADEAGAVTSYERLAELADQFADRLGSEKRLVAIEVANAVLPIAAYLGCLRNGHSVLLLPADAGNRNDRIIERYRPDALYRQAGNDWRLDLTAPEGGLHDDLALLLSTSGTTGAVKLVRLSDLPSMRMPVRLPPISSLQRTSAQSRLCQSTTAMDCRCSIRTFAWEQHCC